MPTATLDELLDYLVDLGADDTQHTHGSLRQHLRGTYGLLREWQAPERLCLAGLFHSVYGTETFTKTTVPLEQRETIRQLIGADAEELVYLWGRMRRASLYQNLDNGWPYSLMLRDGSAARVDLDDFVALITLDFANRLEQTHGPIDDRDLATYSKAIPVLPGAAVSELSILEANVPTLRRIARVVRRIPGARRARGLFKRS
jgi:hypothetical protein